MNGKRICVYCGAALGGRPDYARAADELGRLLVARGLGLVYGGTSVGLMGRIAEAALSAGGEVIGVIPEILTEREIAHRGLAKLLVVTSLYQRKQLMFEHADGFIALPGGLGTLDELSEMLTWAQLGYHRKPVGLLNLGGYYDHLIAFLDHATSEGLIRPEHRALLRVETTPAALLDALGFPDLPLDRAQVAGK